MKTKCDKYILSLLSHLLPTTATKVHAMTVVPSPPKHIKEGIELLQESWTRHRRKGSNSVAQASQDGRVPRSDVEQVDVDVAPGQGAAGHGKGERC